MTSSSASNASFSISSYPQLLYEACAYLIPSESASDQTAAKNPAAPSPLLRSQLGRDVKVALGLAYLVAYSHASTVLFMILLSYTLCIFAHILFIELGGQLWDRIKKSHQPVKLETLLVVLTEYG